jgi:hypothetical protein
MCQTVQKVITAIEAQGRIDAGLAAADAAREVTVAVDLFRSNGDVLAVTLTGIAPFVPAQVSTLFSTGWTVLGQPYASRSGLRMTKTKAVRADGSSLVFGLPLLTNPEAQRLSRAIEIALNANQKAA